MEGLEFKVPTLAVLVLFGMCAFMVQAQEEQDPAYWNKQAHDLLFEKKDYTMQKTVIVWNIHWQDSETW